jgi:hypothetical protein
MMIVSSYCGLNLLLGQKQGPAAVFGPALEQIQSRTRIPILLPSRLPSRIRERDIKLAYGEVRKDGYFISLYFSEVGSDAAYAAGFGGSTTVVRDLQNTRRLKLAGGHVGWFRPVSCGGSCAPATLFWEQNGVHYQIQIKLPAALTEQEQQRTLVEAVDSAVFASRE